MKKIAFFICLFSASGLSLADRAPSVSDVTMIEINKMVKRDRAHNRMECEVRIAKTRVEVAKVQAALSVATAERQMAVNLLKDIQGGKHERELVKIIASLVDYNHDLLVSDKDKAHRLKQIGDYIVAKACEDDTVRGCK